MVLNGKNITKKLEVNLKRQIEKLNRPPCLAIILVGKNPASLIYVKLKEKKASVLGIKIKRFDFPSSTSQKNIIALIKNLIKKTDGIIVQLPLPKHLNTNKIIETIPVELDVDGFRKNSLFVSPTHQAILCLLKKNKIKLAGKKAIILANSFIFSQPLKKLLEKEKIKTEILINPSKQNFSQFDIIITALGKPYFIKPKMINKKNIIIDVGYNRVKGKPVGDVDPKCQKVATFVSPVPGGIGPLTIFFLLKNVYLSAKNKQALLKK
jgi:methylenetetrahydrofolate dehydrogenase (NADP+)/methenyltetrahydrofolate cyclohydrolase